MTPRGRLLRLRKLRMVVEREVDVIAKLIVKKWITEEDGDNLLTIASLGEFLATLHHLMLMSTIARARVLVEDPIEIEKLWNVLHQTIDSPRKLFIPGTGADKICDPILDKGLRDELKHIFDT